MNECSSDGEHLTMRCCPLSVAKVGQHFYFIAISNRCCYKILNDKLQYNHLRVDEGGTHHIGVEEGGGFGEAEPIGVRCRRRRSNPSWSYGGCEATECEPHHDPDHSGATRLPESMTRRRTGLGKRRIGSSNDGGT
jgi:hypothetical protein